ncbi:TyrR/PhhR family helix-turn-helix DNA-binding protein, partial [Pseudomonas syringae group genomosp. 7]|uniref:TyrR/PhhR family helix-turn-helix DNA-binding protein n=1 Tax=Pseudomonas syringae group genomosp. 7 TaxID=251699 RepID=UPI00377058BF
FNHNSQECRITAIIRRIEKTFLEQIYPHYPSSRQLAKRLVVSHTTIANKLRDYDLGRESGRNAADQQSAD